MFYILLLDVEVLLEVEFFKIVIILYFVCYWLFVFYIVVLFVVGLFINKFYCCYVCLLGVGLVILGYFYKFEWFICCKECGKLCIMCYYKCDIKVIMLEGKVDYNECVQCLECIVYYNNDDLCFFLKKVKKGFKRKFDMVDFLVVEVR